MALTPGGGDHSVEAAPAAILDNVAKCGLARGFAHKAVIEGFAHICDGREDLLRPVDGRAFFVAGDEEGDGAGQVRPLGKHTAGGLHHGGKLGFHVHGTATNQLSIPYLRGEGGDGPGGFIAHGDHICVPGKAEIGPGRAKAGVEIVHVIKGEPPGPKTQALQGVFKDIQCARIERRD